MVRLPILDRTKVEEESWLLAGTRVVFVVRILRKQARETRRGETRQDEMRRDKTR